MRDMNDNEDISAEDALLCCKGMIEELIERVQRQRSEIDKAPYPANMAGENMSYFLKRAVQSANWGLEQFEPEKTTPMITIIADRRS